MANFDCEMFDIYLEQIREPYTRKIFNENYEFDKLDFKNISQEYQISKVCLIQEPKSKIC